MKEFHRRPFLDLTQQCEAAFIASARDTEPVRGLTHGFYKYPARFSPVFVRAAIGTFTRPGDLVLDNHVGGGTTLVEALASGRHAVGVDISTLAEFVARVKTTIFAEAELEKLEAWSKRIFGVVGLRKSSIHFADYAEAGYYKHLDHPSRWRLRKAIEQALGAAIRLHDHRLESFGRCVVLSTAQWALDGRANLPSVGDFRDCLGFTATEMVKGARALHAAVKSTGYRSQIEIINRSAAGIEDDERLRSLQPPRLVITSPPYPGVHVLYHRWQVDGRKEAPLPFMIANKLDGAGSSYYTMGDRKLPELATYFANIKSTMSSVARIADKDTIVVQMLAFSDPDWQLNRYLRTMDEAGLQEMFLQTLQGERDGRLWRNVPNRKWHARQQGETSSSREVVLFFRRER
jgi:hypothetical protein